MVCGKWVRRSKCPCSFENYKSAWKAPYLWGVIAFLKHMGPSYIELVWLVWEEFTITGLQVMKIKHGQMLLVYFMKGKTCKHKKNRTKTNPQKIQIQHTHL